MKHGDCSVPCMLKVREGSNENENESRLKNRSLLVLSLEGEGVRGEG